MVEQLARYIGLRPEVVEAHNLRIDRAEHDKMRKDLVNLMEKCLPK
jgi:hypothetical protein